MNDENKNNLDEMDFGNPKNESILWIKSRIKSLANPRFFGALLLTGLVAWAALSTRQVRALQEREELGRVRMNLIKLQQSLLIPSEIIYYDPNLSRMDLAAARIKGYEFYGVEGILPYSMVQDPSLGSSYSPQVGEGPLEYANGNLEQWWGNHSTRACRQLRFDIELDQDIGKYLEQNPAVFDAHIRPLIVRMLDFVWPFSREDACEVLLAMGDRSEEVLEIVKLMDFCVVGGNKSAPIFEKYGIDPEAVTVTIPKSDSSHESLLAWKRTHEIVKELKKKYPLEPETVIHDWEDYCFDGKEQL
ncbi:MAG: hypothetical protein JXR40_04510 [Pontiellaceae bacterium]|nr:hypothetical protein [Pontiellaceae bacterium]